MGAGSPRKAGSSGRGFQERRAHLGGPGVPPTSPVSTVMASFGACGPQAPSIGACGPQPPFGHPLYGRRGTRGPSIGTWPPSPKPARGRSAADLGSRLAIPWFAPSCCPRRARGGEPSLVRDEGSLGIAYCINMQLGCLAMVGFDSEAGLRALADPRRRRMLALVWDRERSSSDLARRCELTRPAASQHLRVLREADLVSVRSDGNRRLYRVRADRLAELRAMLDEFWGSRQHDS
jgi:DNA-binding transcriptional ArsR family regulator